MQNWHSTYYLSSLKISSFILFPLYQITFLFLYIFWQSKGFNGLLSLKLALNLWLYMSSPGSFVHAKLLVHLWDAKLSPIMIQFIWWWTISLGQLKFQIVSLNKIFLLFFPPLPLLWWVNFSYRPVLNYIVDKNCYIKLSDRASWLRFSQVYVAIIANMIHRPLRVFTDCRMLVSTI